MRALLRTTGSLAAGVLLLMSVAAVASAQEATDITLDSPIRSFELGPTEERVDLDVKLLNTAASRRLVKLTLEGLPDGWDIGVWNRIWAASSRYCGPSMTRIWASQCPMM